MAKTENKQTITTMNHAPSLSLQWTEKSYDAYLAFFTAQQSDSNHVNVSLPRDTHYSNSVRWNLIKRHCYTIHTEPFLCMGIPVME
jgi:hypothetical protein